MSGLPFLNDNLDDDYEHCPRCDGYYVWDGDSEASRVCPECRTEDAALYEFGHIEPEEQL